ncbi:hypothetical protein BT63DRAFT_459817 [Microthyrium microscopicum]|uniref:Uncharacterized protein n=1 Tax=Microthyrium microscopicum TaxID=703497 RepID=A0A6A6TYN9_9PEZI|nr:hypothetical protein BT63DRAFT_459817 [Microthyrium microscopicum]
MRFECLDGGKALAEFWAIFPKIPPSVAARLTAAEFTSLGFALQEGGRSIPWHQLRLVVGVWIGQGSPEYDTTETRKQRLESVFATVDITVADGKLSEVKDSSDILVQCLREIYRALKVHERSAKMAMDRVKGMAGDIAVGETLEESFAAMGLSPDSDSTMAWASQSLNLLVGNNEACQGEWQQLYLFDKSDYHGQRVVGFTAVGREPKLVKTKAMTT